MKTFFVNSTANSGIKRFHFYQTTVNISGEQNQILVSQSADGWRLAKDDGVVLKHLLFSSKIAIFDTVSNDSEAEGSTFRFRY